MGVQFHPEKSSRDGLRAAAQLRRAGGGRGVILYPAIDILDGKAVRLARAASRTRPSTTTTRSRPRESWVEAGARFLHVVDLDGARAGEPRVARPPAPDRRRAPASRSSTAAACARVDAVRDALRAGAERVIVGTAAFRDVDFLDEIVAAYGPRDRRRRSTCADGMIATAGWTQTTELPAADAIGRLTGRGVALVRLHRRRPRRHARGPGPRRASRAVADAVRGRFLYSGGIGSLDDLRALARAAPGQPRRRDRRQGALREALHDRRGPGRARRRGRALDAAGAGRTLGVARARGERRRRGPRLGRARHRRGRHRQDEPRRALRRRERRPRAVLWRRLRGAEHAASARSAARHRTRRRRRARRSAWHRGPIARRSSPPLIDALASAPSPAILVLEDIHWADAATLDLIRFAVPAHPPHAGAAAAHLPRRRLGLGRPLSGCSARSRRAMSPRIALPRLTADAVRQAAAQARGVASPALHRRHAVATRSSSRSCSRTPATACRRRVTRCDPRQGVAPPRRPRAATCSTCCDRAARDRDRAGRRGARAARSTPSTNACAVACCTWTAPHLRVPPRARAGRASSWRCCRSARPGRCTRAVLRGAGAAPAARPGSRASCITRTRPATPKPSLASTPRAACEAASRGALRAGARALPQSALSLCATRSTSGERAELLDDYASYSFDASTTSATAVPRARGGDRAVRAHRRPCRRQCAALAAPPVHALVRALRDAEPRRRAARAVHWLETARAGSRRSRRRTPSRRILRMLDTATTPTPSAMATRAIALAEPLGQRAVLATLRPTSSKGRGARCSSIMRAAAPSSPARWRSPTA